MTINANDCSRKSIKSLFCFPLSFLLFGSIPNLDLQVHEFDPRFEKLSGRMEIRNKGIGSAGKSLLKRLTTQI